MITAMLLVAAMLVQVVLINRLPLTVPPDLVLLVLTARVLGCEPPRGALIGFCAGLAVDVLPPAAQTVGQYALVYCLIGLLAARLGPGWGTVAAATLASVAGPALAMAASALLGDPRIPHGAVGVVVTAAAANLVAAPVVVWGVTRLPGGPPAGAAHPWRVSS